MAIFVAEEVYAARAGASEGFASASARTRFSPSAAS
jgi:hypothetical protein